MVTAASTIRQSAFATENVMKIAVSYSGKERKRVFKITRIIQQQMTTPQCSDPVFIDQDYQHETCRLNGLSHLLSIYRQAHMVIVFLSPTYTDSRYCSGEWRTIAQRFLSNRKNKEATQLLLVKLGPYDMNELDLVDSDFPIDGQRLSNEQIADLILRRWKIVEQNLQQRDQ
ncbi:unnamed protein product [Rotaria sp. Silwood1]|nr:unnamed protein product [Rotaria sp. Silwood1]